MQAINSFDSVVAVSQEELESIYQQAQKLAYQRRSGEVLSRDIMSADVITVGEDMPLGMAWKILHKHKISMLPVVNEERELLGVIPQCRLFEEFVRTKLCRVIETLEPYTGKTKAPKRSEQ